MRTRIITGIILATIALILDLWCYEAVLATVSFVGAICSQEMWKMMTKRSSPFIFLVGGLLTAAFAMRPQLTGDIIAVSFVIMTSITMWDKRLEDNEARWRFASGIVMGPIMIPLLCSTIPRLRALDHGAEWVIYMAVIAFMQDTFAYFGGRKYGKTPMHPVSGKKTVEGAYCGVFASGVFAIFVGALLLPHIEIWWHACIGLLGGIMGINGDLYESLAKRICGVKDSGTLLPGHGGMLDRVDGLVFVAPVVFALAAGLQGS